MVCENVDVKALDEGEGFNHFVLTKCKISNGHSAVKQARKCYVQLSAVKQQMDKSGFSSLITEDDVKSSIKYAHRVKCLNNTVKL